MSKHWSSLPRLTPNDLGEQVPKKHRPFAQKIAQFILPRLGWQVTGSIPNVGQAVLIGVPHTSNYDAVPAFLMLLALGLDIRILGKKQLFSVPILAQFLRWIGVMPIDRTKKGSVLQSSIANFADNKPLFLALAPEGTRSYTTSFKSGFYYLAVGAGVPIIPVALDYATKTICFMPPFYPTGDYVNDLPQIVALYQGVQGRHPHKMSQILQDLSSQSTM